MVSNRFISTHILHDFSKRAIDNFLCSVIPIKMLTANQSIYKNTELTMALSGRLQLSPKTACVLNSKGESAVGEPQEGFVFPRSLWRSTRDFLLKEFKRLPPWQVWMQWQWIRKMIQFPAGRYTAFWTTVSFVWELMFGEGQVKGYKMRHKLVAPGASSAAIRNPTTCKFMILSLLAVSFLIRAAFPVHSGQCNCHTWVKTRGFRCLQTHWYDTDDFCSGQNVICKSEK